MGSIRLAAFREMSPRSEENLPGEEGSGGNRAYGNRVFAAGQMTVGSDVYEGCLGSEG